MEWKQVVSRYFPLLDRHVLNIVLSFSAIGGEAYQVMLGEIRVQGINNQDNLKCHGVQLVPPIHVWEM